MEQHKAGRISSQLGVHEQCVRWIGHPGPMKLIGREVRREVVDQSGHNLGAGFEARDLGKLVGGVVGLTTERDHRTQHQRTHGGSKEDQQSDGRTPHRLVATAQAYPQTRAATARACVKWHTPVRAKLTSKAPNPVICTS